VSCLVVFALAAAAAAAVFCCCCCCWLLLLAAAAVVAATSAAAAASTAAAAANMPRSLVSLYFFSPLSYTTLEKQKQKQFFDELETSLASLQVSGYGITITSLEEVFLKVGGDHDLTGDMASGQGLIAGGTGGSGSGGGGGAAAVGAGSAAFSAVDVGGRASNGDDDHGDGGGGNDSAGDGGGDSGYGDGDDGGGDGDLSLKEFRGQVAGLWRKRVAYASNDWLKSFPTMILPSAAIAAAFVLNLENVYGSAWKPGGI
jgi:hypothetical protein